MKELGTCLRIPKDEKEDKPTEERSECRRTAEGGRRAVQTTLFC